MPEASGRVLNLEHSCSLSYPQPPNGGSFHQGPLQTLFFNIYQKEKAQDKLPFYGILLFSKLSITPLSSISVSCIPL